MAGAPRADDPVLAADLARAVARDELFLVYQPKLDCRTGRINSAEGLLRWQHPVRGSISPADFIPVAERTGSIRALTCWVIERAIADQATLAAAGHVLTLNVNLSARLAGDAAFTRWALAAVARAVGTIGLELTETAAIDDPEAALANMHAFADAGVHIAIDDYGAGLSSLAYLKQLPASELKIDRMFISGLADSHRDPLLVRSTIDLAHALGMEVTAEGVETPVTLALLRVMGCDQVQGWAIARPMALEALRVFLSSAGPFAEPGRPKPELIGRP
ncbi:MAG: EAL domain-containing protein [Sphingomonas fennica]